MKGPVVLAVAVLVCSRADSFLSVSGQRPVSLRLFFGYLEV